MNIFFGCVRLGAARLARRPGRLLGLLLLPLGVLLLGLLLPPERLDRPLEAGVCLPADAPAAEAVAEALDAADSRYILVHRADRDTLYAEVAAGRWECGLILDDDFETRCRERDPGRLATVVRARSGTLSPLLAEMFASALYHVRAPWLAADYAAQNDLLGDGESLDELVRTVTAGTGSRMQLEVRAVDGAAGQTGLAAATAASACRGVIAVFLFLFALTEAEALAAAAEEDWFRRTAALTGRRCLTLGLAASGTLAGALCGLAAYALTGHFFGGADVAGAAALALYAGMLGAFAAALSRVPGVRQALPVLLPFLPAACLVLCPVFFDAGRVFPPARAVSALLPPTWLLHAMDGQGAAILLLAGAACVLAAALPLPRGD